MERRYITPTILLAMHSNIPRESNRRGALGLLERGLFIPFFAGTRV
jgi:hypothetical protein